MARPFATPSSFSLKLLLGAIFVATVEIPLHAETVYDLILRGGTIYNGSGNPPVTGDIAVSGDRIAASGKLVDTRGKQEIDVRGLAVAPGFINMLSWANESLLYDGRSQSDIRQGVTLEVMGEGNSMGPFNPVMQNEQARRQADIHYSVKWQTLGQYLDLLVNRGISCNVASFVGASTVRVHELGAADIAPNAEQLARMQQLVREAMEEGAMGVASALIYAPGCYAKTDELIALAQAAAAYDGLYTSHLRSEANQFLEALDELIEIARDAKIRANIFHLKAAGETNWDKLAEAIKKIETARADGLEITADMYTYTAGATGLDAAMPTWVQEGGYHLWAKRLQDPQIRTRLAEEMVTPSSHWESLYLAAGSPERVLLVGFKNAKLKPLTGKTLAEVARLRGQSPQETIMDLVVEDGSRVGTIYFLMSEENVRRQLALPWVAFDSDESSLAPEGPFLKSNPHPRAYGNFARLLGKYVRDEKIVPLEQAIHRLTSFPAETLRIRDRGRLQPGYYADIVVFDPKKIQDHATYDKPHQYSTGVVHVFVNGDQVLQDGEHTGAKPGRVVRGPGWKGWSASKANPARRD
ncbi:MAG: D-aminoacylase [Pirellulales bacterium]|nr:D-aminoacylase [Pirellulales bacterium]